MPEKTVSEMSEAEFQKAKRDRLKAERSEVKPAMKLSEKEYQQARRRLAGNPRD